MNPEPLLTMTTKREKATAYSVNDVTRALSAYRLAFPGYTLSVEPNGEGRFLIASEGMTVQRWGRE